MKQEYKTILGDIVEVEEKEPIFNTHEIGFVSLVTAVFTILVTFVALLLAPKVMGNPEPIWVDEQGYVYSYEETTVPDMVSIMYNGELTEIENKKGLRYAENPNGENVVVQQDTLRTAVSFLEVAIVCTIVITICVIGAIIIRWIFLGRKE